MVKFLDKHRTHVTTFLALVLVEVLMLGADYFSVLLNVTEEQVFDISFWKAIGISILATVIRALIRTVVLQVINKFNKPAQI